MRDVARLIVGRDSQQRCAWPQPNIVYNRRQDMIIKPSPVIPCHKDTGIPPIVLGALHNRVDSTCDEILTTLQLVGWMVRSIVPRRNQPRHVCEITRGNILEKVI